MARPTPLALLAALVLSLSPSVAPAAGDAPAPGRPAVLPRSSLAAVLAQRGTLDLTPDQVKELERLEARLARDQDALREAASRSSEASSGRDAPRPPQGGGAPQGAGPGMAGGKTRPAPSVKPRGPDPAEVLRTQLDTLDTEAMLAALELLPESKREKAVEIASRYREQLFEQREREQGR
ncbi:MAG TPA: hypothetical protein VFM53_16750 [Anaeromyxobacteraceae bacterium]|nr:hypothetical protein [Anaeromyxobacteraceae bacterium]